MSRERTVADSGPCLLRDSWNTVPDHVKNIVGMSLPKSSSGSGWTLTIQIGSAMHVKLTS